MFFKNKLKPQHQHQCPPGVTPLNNEDRKPIMRVVSGDTWVVSAEFVAEDGGPANPDNSVVEFVLAENQFSPPIWTGGWFEGVFPDKNRPGLAHVNLPRSVTKTLRRGSYMFSARVGNRTRFSFSTQLVGYFLVEYMPTSDQHSIPYRDGTSDIFCGSASAEDISSSSEGVIYVRDESSGLYYKVVAYEAEDGEVCLGIYQDGVQESVVAPLGVCPTLHVLDKASGLYHRLIAYKDDFGEVCLGIYQEGVSEAALPALDVGKPVRVRNEANGLLHNIEANKTEDGEVGIGIHQSGTFV